MKAVRQKPVRWLIPLVLAVCLPVAAWRLAHPIAHPKLLTMTEDFGERVAEGRYWTAWRRSLEMVVLDPESEQARYLHRVSSLILNRFEKVDPKVTYPRALEMLVQHPQDPYLTLIAAELAYKLDRPLESLALVRRALELQPGMPRALELLEQARGIPWSRRP